jgi:hypothetical protein
MRDYRDIASRREAKRSLPEAWLKLVEEPEDLLVELLSEQTEALSGYRPTSAEVSEFLKSLRLTIHATAPAADPVGQATPVRNGPRAAKGKRYEVWDELLPGFIVRVSTKCRKTWYLATRINKCRRRIKIGD